jgi:hypothetical protein
MVGEKTQAICRKYAYISKIVMENLPSKVHQNLLMVHKSTCLGEKFESHQYNLGEAL